MKTFVAGATGQTGQQVVRELAARNLPAIAWVRNRELAQRVLPTGVDIAVGDVLSPDSIRAGIADCTTLICATGAKPSLDPTGPFQVDYLGTKNLVDVAKEKGIEHFVLVSSLCVSQFFHPLNLFWLVLYWKKQAEEYLKQSGLTYTIVRPGGLLGTDNDLPIVMQPEDRLFDGRIPRIKVARTCVEALVQPAARNHTVEIITDETAKERSLAELFAGVGTR